MHRKCFEALDRSFRDVLSATDSSLADIPFGGKVVVLGGDLDRFCRSLRAVPGVRL